MGHSFLSFLLSPVDSLQILLMILITDSFHTTVFFKYTHGTKFCVDLEQVEGFKMNLIYYDLYQATRLEKFVTGMSQSVCCKNHAPTLC